VAQIAKSIVFRLKEADASFFVVASGGNRVNEKEILVLWDIAIPTRRGDWWEIVFSHIVNSLKMGDFPSEKAI